ncbi:MAG: GNAT family N-acetyltransferase [Nocardioides sp.]|uniref:GNAT family N-acetyltransferase n=1 Tax=Nocardioides sp. TaxID=35761 RepID=UPI003D6C129F
MTVRMLEPTEWATALDLRVAAMTESPEAFGSSVPRERGLSLETWEARLTDNAWFAAFDADVAVGLACGIHTDSATERELTGLWVAPSHRGTGLGDALVITVRDWAALEGAQRLTLEVVGTNRSAVGLYERHGFAVVEQTEIPRTGLRETDIVMSLDLCESNPKARRVGSS